MTVICPYAPPHEHSELYCGPRACIHEFAGLADYHAQAKRRADAADSGTSSIDVRSKMRHAGVPNQVLFDLENERLMKSPSEAMKATREWWGSNRRAFPVLAMAGDVGLGKTVASAWAAQQWARGYPWNQLPTGSTSAPLVWFEGSRLRELGAFGEKAVQQLADGKNAALLVADDLGREGDRRAHEAVSDMVIERLNQRRLTIVTTNLNGTEFRAMYGTGLADRIRAVAVMPKLKGDSLRGAA